MMTNRYLSLYCQDVVAPRFPTGGDVNQRTMSTYCRRDDDD
eukprot:CAMPEP_0172489732 /NCGR_PEP_ID=MMETSP1066-20121228/19937_1 /TAXON_ID=671091 /ORGANISM="Coscinodiscus wailesii, Strain CCMP2513" /LENGTH=40 /DNA_ID= /DNA_START= /DNA_END= /DNA_ORIENTATION=